MYTSTTRRYKITNKKLAKWFGYSSEYTFNSSSAKQRILQGIEQLVQYIEDQTISKIKG